MTCRGASALAQTNAASRASRTRCIACKTSAAKASKAQRSTLTHSFDQRTIPAARRNQTGTANPPMRTKFARSWRSLTSLLRYLACISATVGHPPGGRREVFLRRSFRTST
jgi:hypothetical protein